VIPFERHIAALGSERHLDGIRHNIDAAQHLAAGCEREFDILGNHLMLLAAIA
jgi:hypothetical protein